MELLENSRPAAQPGCVQPRRLHLGKMFFVALCLGALFFWQHRRYRRPGVDALPTLDLSGFTMGTTWSVRIADSVSDPEQRQTVRKRIEETLAEVNRQMSVYHPDSEISQFNRLPANVPMAISAEFAEVLRFAITLAERSEGAFDPTVAPLVNLWGFGPGGDVKQPPEDEAIAQAREWVGVHLIEWRGPQVICKKSTGTQLDLNAVAKGYGVDRVAEALAHAGYRNFMVEIGGEVVTRGQRPGGGPWRIGVDSPRAEAAPGTDLRRILHVHDAAVATSGDYRNFIEASDGVSRWTHIIDPRLGRPVRRMAGSVTVVAERCLIADGLATALYVMGPDEGLPWLAQHYPDAEALFILRAPDGTLTELVSKGFDARTRPTP